MAGGGVVKYIDVNLESYLSGASIGTFGKNAALTLAILSILILAVHLTGTANAQAAAPLTASNFNCNDGTTIQCAQYASYLVYQSDTVTVSPTAIYSWWQGTSYSGTPEDSASTIEGYISTFGQRFPECLSGSLTSANAITSASGLASVLELANYDPLTDSGAYSGSIYGGSSSLLGLGGSSSISNTWYMQMLGSCAAVEMGISYPSSQPDSTSVSTWSDTTNYNANAGQFTPQAGDVSNTPVANQIINYNTANALWLVTCPVDPSTISSAVNYFVTDSSTFIAGDRCTANTLSPLETTIYIRAFTYNTKKLDQAASSIPAVSVANTAAPIAYDIGYSGELNSTSSNSLNISNGYESQSNIFGGVPSYPQQGVWTWNSRYTNFGGTQSLGTAGSTTDLNSLPLEQGFVSWDGILCGEELGYLCPYFAENYVYAWSCTYTYDYHQSTTLQGINNWNVPVMGTVPDVKVSSYLSYNGIPYGPVTPSSTTGGFFSCAHAMYSGILAGTPFCSEPGPSLGGSANLHYSGANGGSASGVTVYSDSSNPSRLWFGYYSTSGTYVEAYVDGYDPTKSAFVSSNVLPYLLYNLTIPVRASDVSAGVIGLNLSLNIYSPTNLQNPTQSLDPFTLYTDGGMFYTNSGNLAEGSVTGGDSVFASSLTVANLSKQAGIAVSNPGQGLLKPDAHRLQGA